MQLYSDWVQDFEDWYGGIEPLDDSPVDISTEDAALTYSQWLEAQLQQPFIGDAELEARFSRPEGFLANQFPGVSSYLDKLKVLVGLSIEALLSDEDAVDDFYYAVGARIANGLCLD